MTRVQGLKMAGLVSVISAIALLLHPLGYLGKNIWPPSDICPLPTAAQFPFFVVLAVIEAGALGLGIAWLVWGYKFVRFLRYRWQRAGVFIALSWHMCNWAMHDGFHQIAGIDLDQILLIEYAFHLTLIAATCVTIAALIAQANYCGPRGISIQ